MLPVMRLARHLEGWQPGLLAIGIALSGALLAFPRATPPEDLPSPAVDERALAQTMAEDRERASRLAPELEREISGAGPTTLYDLRALGQAIREFGLADSAEDREDRIVSARQNLGKALIRARALGEERLLALRAYEAKLFLRAVREWEETRVAPEDLTALGGPFLAMLERNGWLRDGRIVPNQAIRAILFKLRWNELTGLSQGPFAPTLDEQRAFYRFLLDHPPKLATASAPTPQAAQQSLDQWRLRKLEELAQIDPSYPYQMARGVLLYRLGAHLPAAQAFRDHLEEHPDGWHALRVRNYLRAALDRAAHDP